MRKGGVIMYTLGQLARHVAGELVGDPEQTIKGAAPVATARSHEITFATNAKSLALAAKCSAGAIVVGRDVADMERPIIRTDNPRLAFARVLALFAPPTYSPAGIDETAVIAADAHLEPEATIGPGVVVGPASRIGHGVTVHAGTYIGRDVHIGADSVIYPNVVIMDGVRIGRRVVLQPGAVIGSDGFGYVPTEKGHHKMPHIGTVVIEDDVEIGVNSAVARATMGATRIGKGSKLDGYVYVAHNVDMGEHVVVAGMSALAGSASVGDNVTLAGQTGVVGHIHVGAGTVVLARSLVTADVAPGSYVSGNPARPHRDNMRALAAGRRVPALAEEVARLKRRLETLEAELHKNEADSRCD